MSRALAIRPVEMTDLEDIVRVDEKLTGHTRKEYWRTRLEIAALRPPWMSLVAETDGRPVGFLFGWVGESEFGIPGRTGWVDLIAAALGPALAGADEPHKIGAIFSITGPGSSLGIPERDTAQMLEAQINARGGVMGPDGKRHPLKIVIYDDASDETKAVLAARKLIDEDRVTAIVGTTLSGTSLAILKEAGLTILLVEQNARAALGIADRSYALGPGGLIAELGRDGGGAAEETRATDGLELSREEVP